MTNLYVGETDSRGYTPAVEEVLSELDLNVRGELAVCREATGKR